MALLLRDESVGLAMVCLEEWIVESIVDGLVGMICSAYLLLTVARILYIYAAGIVCVAAE